MLDGGWFAEAVAQIPVFLEPLRDVAICNRSARRRRVGEKGDREGNWEVVLPKQPYYVNEVGRLNVEMRERGLRCVVRV